MSPTSKVACTDQRAARATAISIRAGRQVDTGGAVARLGEKERGPTLAAAKIENLGVGRHAQLIERIADRRPLQERLDPQGAPKG